MSIPTPTMDNHTNGSGWYSPSFDTVSALVGLHLNINVTARFFLVSHRASHEGSKVPLNTVTSDPSARNAEAGAACRNSTN